MHKSIYFKLKKPKLNDAYTGDNTALKQNKNNNNGKKIITLLVRTVLTPRGNRRRCV